MNSVEKTYTEYCTCLALQEQSSALNLSADRLKHARTWEVIGLKSEMRSHTRINNGALGASIRNKKPCYLINNRVFILNINLILSSIFYKQSLAH